jgi:hypothetical protein
MAKSTQQVESAMVRGALRQETDADDAVQLVRDSTAESIYQRAMSKFDALDLRSLASELSLLRQAMRKEASTPEQDIAIASVAQAETAAASEKKSDVFRHLKDAGQWALDVAQTIGVEIAVAAVKASLGL